MSEYTLELFTADGKYIIKDAKGDIITDGPLAKADAFAKLDKLQAPAPIPKKTKKTPKPKKVIKEEKQLNEFLLIQVVVMKSEPFSKFLPSRVQNSHCDIPRPEIRIFF